MAKVTLYTPEGIRQYDAVAKAQLVSGSLDFETEKGCLLKRKPIGSPEFQVKCGVKKVRTNVPFIVEEEMEG